jgi:signal transduction histidine kinase
VGVPAPALNDRAHRGNLLGTDGLPVILLTGVALGSLIYRALQGPETPTGGVQFGTADVLAMVLLLAGTLCVKWRRRAALPVLVVSSTAFAVSEMLGSASPLLPFAPLMALYAVAAIYAPGVSGSAAGALAVGAFTVSVANPGPLDDDFLDYLLSVGAAWLLGYGVRLSRARTLLLEDQARQLRREQAAKTQAAVRQEQTRIARELHDIVAHHVVVMVAQAGAAKRVFHAEPDHARHALVSIETIGREALTETRRLLGVLSTGEGGSRAPQPGLEQLPTLVGQTEQAGLPVQLTVRGTPRPLPAGVELNAYRIVQEALTNTLKHAGPTRAEVELTYHPDVLELRIRDDGRGSAPNLKPGHGLVGMGQRAALLGGEVSVGPRPHRGFQVKATLPVNGERL